VSDQNEEKSVADPSGRNFLGVGSPALATAALVGITAPAQVVPRVATHAIENTGNTDCKFLPRCSAVCEQQRRRPEFNSVSCHDSRPILC
jgi:hypothetical protein